MERYNWLVHRIHDQELERALRIYANGVLVDIGCGKKPYTSLTKRLVTKHIGIDHPDMPHGCANLDVFASAYKVSLPSCYADTILCTAVLEHLERPQDAIREMYRILKPGGHVILSAPLFWHLHEEPRDFYRYTRYGLTHLFTTAGFEVLEIKPLAGFVVTFAQELVYFLNCLRRGPVKHLVTAVQWAIQALAYLVNRWDRSHGFTWAYLAVVWRPQLREQLLLGSG